MINYLFLVSRVHIFASNTKKIPYNQQQGKTEDPRSLTNKDSYRTNFSNNHRKFLNRAKCWKWYAKILWSWVLLLTMLTTYSMISGEILVIILYFIHSPSVGEKYYNQLNEGKWSHITDKLYLERKIAYPVAIYIYSEWWKKGEDA